MKYFSIEPGLVPASSLLTMMVTVLQSLHVVAGRREPACFELVAAACSVSVRVGCCDRIADHLAAQLQAQHPDAILTGLGVCPKAG